MAANSWFDNAKLTKVEVLEFCCKLVLLIYSVLNYISLLLIFVGFVMQQLQFDNLMSSKTTVYWSNFCRQVCIDDASTQPQPIGRPGKIVEIDESLFSKKKYVKG